jgi:hypothetical protein
LDLVFNSSDNDDVIWTYEKISDDMPVSIYNKKTKIPLAMYFNASSEVND